MKSIYILGDGQLGQMLRQAGDLLGIKVFPIGINDALKFFPYQESIITAEIECWPKTPLTTELTGKPNFINRNIFSKLVDRLLQKKLLNSLSITTTPWFPLINQMEWKNIFNVLGDFVIVKSRKGGYNGHKQWYITPHNVSLLSNEIYGNSIVEKVIPFSDEVSLIGSRNLNNQCVFYPLTYNLHQEGILRSSLSFPHPSQKLQTQAEHILSTIMKKLNYIGVMTMECFLVNDELLVNELSPRVHNSGHWTQNGASISQFELHLRAILNLPTPTPNIEAISIMINLIGIELNPKWLSLPLVNLHWYKKDVRPGRKVGHINLSSYNWKKINNSLNKMQILLPCEYRKSIKWIKNKISVLFMQK